MLSISRNTIDNIYIVARKTFNKKNCKKKLKISTTTVWNIIKKKEDTRSVVNQKQSGHQQITSATEDRRIATTSKRNKPLTAPEITNRMNNSIIV